MAHVGTAQTPFWQWPFPQLAHSRSGQPLSRRSWPHTCPWARSSVPEAPLLSLPPTGCPADVLVINTWTRHEAKRGSTHAEAPALSAQPCSLPAATGASSVSAPHRACPEPRTLDTDTYGPGRLGGSAWLPDAVHGPALSVCFTCRQQLVSAANHQSICKKATEPGHPEPTLLTGKPRLGRGH